LTSSIHIVACFVFLYLYGELACILTLMNLKRNKNNKKYTGTRHLNFSLALLAIRCNLLLVQEMINPGKTGWGFHNNRKTSSPRMECFWARRLTLLGKLGIQLYRIRLDVPYQPQAWVSSKEAFERRQR